MRLHVGYAYTKIIEATFEEESFVREYLTFRSSGFRGQEERQCLLSSSRLFPAGLTRRLCRALRERGIDIHVTARPDTCILKHTESSYLWPHQSAALAAIAEHRRGIVQHATGSGKGTTIASVVASTDRPVLVIVTSLKLLKEMHDRIKSVAGIKPGRLGGGYRELNKRVLVATVQSAAKLPKSILERFEVVLADECHSVPSSGYLRAVMSCINASIRIAFSGTPMDRGDKKTIYIVGAFGEVIHKYMPVDAARDGVTAKAIIRMPPFHHTHVSAASGYNAWEKKAIADNVARNKMILRLIKDSPAPRIVFVRTHHHQKQLMALLGNDAVFVNDKVHPNDAERAVRKLVNGTVGTLVSTPIFRQGVDIPEVATVIQASGGKSTIDVIQKVGRGSRRHQKDGSTKDEFYVYDILDRECGCGGRHKGCQWLETHSSERQAAYERFGYSIYPT